MAKSKHKIEKATAEKLLHDFAAKKEKDNGPYKDLPEGYLFDAADVRTLVNHPDATGFLVRFGWKSNGAKGTITPVLCVLDAKNQIIEEKKAFDIQKSAGNDGDMIMSSALTDASSGSAQEAGGFLDEGLPFPPPASDI